MDLASVLKAGWCVPHSDYALPLSWSPSTRYRDLLLGGCLDVAAAKIRHKEACDGKRQCCLIKQRSGPHRRLRRRIHFRIRSRHYPTPIRCLLQVPRPVRRFRSCDDSAAHARMHTSSSRQTLEGWQSHFQAETHADRNLDRFARWSREPIHSRSSRRAKRARNAAASGANPRCYFTDSTLFGSYKRIACQCHYTVHDSPAST
jgi:hypothetical protein